MVRAGTTRTSSSYRTEVAPSSSVMDPVTWMRVPTCPLVGAAQVVEGLLPVTGDAAPQVNVYVKVSPVEGSVVGSNSTPNVSPTETSAGALNVPLGATFVME